EVSRIFSSLKLPSILGPESFITIIREKYYFDKKSEEITDLKDLNLNPEDIIKSVCRYYKVNKSDLFIKRRGWFNKPRDASIYLVRHLCNFTLNEIADLFQMNTYSTVSNVYLKFKKLIKDDKNIRIDIENLMKKAQKSQEQI
ncbi:MAG: hypothetical protein GY714_17095, partial [Desulfobacterales bacterium]|nr:hypothetical protein [Desulfobacterales bacterium]